MKQKRLISFIGMVCVFMSALFMMTGIMPQNIAETSALTDICRLFLKHI